MKEFIKNRKEQNICVLIEWKNNTGGFAVIMHGLWGFKEQIQIETIRKVFLDNNMAVISFDTTNTFGESDWNYENATVTNYYEDLEDVIHWIETQNYYKWKFYLAGSSLGGICTTLYAQKYPEKIQALAPISTVVSGQWTIDIMSPDVLSEWKTTWYKIKESVSKPWVIKKLKWSHVEDRIKYSVLTKADKLTMPVLLIVWDEDTTTPLEHQQEFFDILQAKKELHIIKWWPHTFKEKKHLDEIYNIFSNWIKKT